MNTEKILTIIDFTKEVRRNLELKLGDDFVVEARTITGYNGQMLNGLTVRRQNENQGPLIYMESFYDAYRSGVHLESLAETIMKRCMKNMDLPIPMGPISESLDWKKVQGRVVYRLINADKNSTILAENPHTRFLDLAQVYYLDFPGKLNERLFIQITNKMLKRWKISTEVLHLSAQRNMPEHFPAKICNICDILEKNRKEFTEEEIEDQDCPLYVLTNQEACFGAAAMLYGNSLEEFANSCLSNIIILPSSVHEVLLFPEDDHTDYKMLRKMVETVNDQNVPAEERLSSHVYRYLRDSKKIEIADES